MNKTYYENLGWSPRLAAEFANVALQIDRSMQLVRDPVVHQTTPAAMNGNTLNVSAVPVAVQTLFYSPLVGEK